MKENVIFFGWSSMIAVSFASSDVMPASLRKLSFFVFGILLFVLLGYWLLAGAVLADFVAFVGQMALASAFSLILIPWVRLAFSDVSQAESEKVLNAREARFRLLTISVASAVLVRLALPHLEKWGQRTSGLEVGVFKLALFEPRRTGRDLELTAAGGRSIGDDATRAVGALTRIVGMGHSEGLGGLQIGLKDVLNRPGPYSKKPMIVRDLLIARYLASNADASRFGALMKEGLKKETENQFSMNFTFARQLATPLRCVVAAAELTRDYRLVMLDVHPLIRWLMRLSIADVESGPTPAADGSIPESEAAKQIAKEDVAGWAALLDAAQKTYLGFIGSDQTGQGEVALACADSGADVAFSNLRRLSGDLTQYSVRNPDDPAVRALRRGPYPTMATAWLLGGIGGTEAAISVLTRWISQHRLPSNFDASASGEVWSHSRAVIELDLLVPNEILDSGNKILNKFYDDMFESLLKYLPSGFDWYGQAACAVAQSQNDLMFHQVQQAFYQSIATIRLRSYRVKIGVNGPTNRIITDDLIEEAKKIAHTKPDCFPLVENYSYNRDLFLGQAAAYVGHLQKAYVDSRIRSQLTEDQSRRLKEARWYFRRARDLLERYQESEHREWETGDRAAGSTNTRLQKLSVSAAEKGVLSGAGAAGPELARITRASIAIDNLIGEE